MKMSTTLGGDDFDNSLSEWIKKIDRDCISFECHEKTRLKCLSNLPKIVDQTDSNHLVSLKAS